MSWARDLVIAANDDPDETMHAELTMRDMALIGVAIAYLAREEPELHAFINKISNKLLEVGIAQEFL